MTDRMVHGNGRTDEGFSLVEVMMVVGVIAILIAFGLPNFLGARRVASDRVAQTTVRTAVLAARTTAVDRGDYSEATPGAVHEAEPSLLVHARSEPAANPNEVSLGVGATGSSVIAITRSATGVCFAARDALSTEDGGTTYAKVAAPECTADAAAALDEAVWQPAW